MAMASGGELVCVTGATGHKGSWLVKRLLERGYRVRAIVTDPNDVNKTAMLTSLPGAKQRLQLFRGHLLEEGSFDEAIYGCDGVFHCAASPTELEFAYTDPYKDCIEPAIQGTINVLKSCSKAPTIKRIVHSSSVGAVRLPQLTDIPGQIFDETCWTNDELLQKSKQPHGWPYFVSKVASEKKAFELAKEYKLDLVSILPSLVTGAFMLDTIPKSVANAISLVTGDSSHHKFIRFISYVHMEDIIDAYIFLYETPAANGRYLASSHDASILDIAKLLRKIYPKINLPKNFDYVGEIMPHSMSSTRIKKLGFEFKHDLEDMLRDAVECCVQKGLLPCRPGEC